MPDDDSAPALRGTVHSFSEGFGYILGDDGVLYSVHVGGLDAGVQYNVGDEPLAAGEAVQFNAREEGDGLIAIDVRPAKKPPAAAGSAPTTT